MVVVPVLYATIFSVPAKVETSRVSGDVLST
jgi:hypothetical protein